MIDCKDCRAINEARKTQATLRKRVAVAYSICISMTVILCVLIVTIGVIASRYIMSTITEVAEIRNAMEALRDEARSYQMLTNTIPPAP